MKKTFCDFCGQEVKYEHGPAVTKTSHKNKISPLKVEISVKTRFSSPGDDDWGTQGDICHYCIIDAFSKLDDRPKEKAE